VCKPALVFLSWNACAAGLTKTSNLPRVPQGKIRSLEQIYLFSLPIKEHQSAFASLLRFAAPLWCVR
jgi:hypothetical protein